MDDLIIEMSCPGCGRQIRVPFAELKERAARCPACGVPVPITEERIDEAVERRMRAERKALKPKLGGL